MPPKKSDRQNIRVAVRCRPINTNERNLGETNVVESCKDSKITLKDKLTSSRSYHFDKVFGPFSKQIDIYNEMVAPTVIEVIEGYNCTIFAYGQTGTGKTFTMTGERSDSLRYTWENDPTAGIVPRALNQMFSMLESSGCDFSVRVSFMELYNEDIYDLLSSGEETCRLAIYEDAAKKGSVVVKGLREVAVINKEDVFTILENGLSRRQTACTQLNAQSSRSHSVFTVTVHIKEVCPKTDEVFLKIGKLNLVDLAGSENIGRSGALDKRAREAGSINQSLLTLGRVITCLVDHAPHVPYRESKLTRLLQDSLGGRTKTSIIATISPGSTSLEETVSTLDYAHRAKNIQNRPEINQKLNKKELIKGYNNELERLRRDLEAARSKSGIFIDADNYQALQLQIKQQRGRIDDLEERRELLESDLETVKTDFELSQQELSDIRSAKEKIEEEFSQLFVNLESTKHQLAITERRLAEEEFLRGQHQSTEEKLSCQADKILFATTAFQNDLGSLHHKMEVTGVMDNHNRNLLTSLCNEWLPEQLKKPITVIQSVKTSVSDQLQGLTTNLEILRQHMALIGEQNIEAISSLSSALSLIVSSNLERASSSLGEFTSNQVAAVEAFKDEAVEPALNTVKLLGNRMTEQLDEMRTRLQTEAEIQSAMFKAVSEKAEAIIVSASVWEQLRQEESEETQRLRNELVSLRDIENSETKCLIESLQEAMLRISLLVEARMNTNNSMDKGLSTTSSRITDTSCKQKAALIKHASDLSASVISANEKRLLTSEAINAALDDCQMNLSQVTESIVSTVGSTFDTFREKTQSVEKEYMSEGGIGTEFARNALEWRKMAMTDKEMCERRMTTDFFNQVVEQTQFTLKVNETRTGESVVGFQDSITSSKIKLADLEIVSACLPELPRQLSEHLDANLRAYNSTGQTPQRARLDELGASYPTNLARTDAHTRLLAEFRCLRGYSSESPEKNSLADLTNRSGRQSSCSSKPPFNNLNESIIEEDEDDENQQESRRSSGVGTISPVSGRINASNLENHPSSAATPEPKHLSIISSE